MRDKVNNEERSYTAYLQDGNEYQMVKKTVDRLPSGFYYPYYDQYRDYCSLKAKKIIMPHLYILPNEIQNGILDDIKNFWGAEERYRRFGHVYKRNILLYSTPGNGKTSLIQQLCNTLINEHDGIVVYVEQSSDLFAYQEAMVRLRDVEPNRRVITVIEDFEKLAKSDECSAKLLQLLDGSSQFDNMVVLSSTTSTVLYSIDGTCISIVPAEESPILLNTHTVDVAILPASLWGGSEDKDVIVQVYDSGVRISDESKVICDIKQVSKVR